MLQSSKQLLPMPCLFESLDMCLSLLIPDGLHVCRARCSPGSTPPQPHSVQLCLFRSYFSALLQFKLGSMLCFDASQSNQPTNPIEHLDTKPPTLAYTQRELFQFTAD